jgi:hypothetical protein
MASNSGDSSASRAQVLSSKSPVQNSSELCPLLMTPRHGPQRKRRTSIVAFVSVAAGKCPLSCCPEMAAGRTIENTVLLLLHTCMLRTLRTSGRCLFSQCLATVYTPNIKFFTVKNNNMLEYHKKWLGCQIRQGRVAGSGTNSTYHNITSFFQ